MDFRDWMCLGSLFWVFYTIGAMGYLVLDIDYTYSPFFVVIGSIALYALGYIVAGRETKKKIRIKLKFKKFGVFSWGTILDLLLIASTLAWALYFIKNRSILLSGIESGRVEAMSGNGVLLYLIEVNIMTIGMEFIRLLNKRISVLKFSIKAIVASVELLSIGYRTPFFTMIVVCIIVLVKTRKIKLSKVIRYAIVLFIVAMVIEIIRMGENGDFLHSLLFRIISRFSLTMHNMNFVFNTFPRFMDFQNGYCQIMDLFILLPGPGQDFTMWLKNAVQISFAGGGLGVPINASFYVDFGYIGMCIGMFLLGIFHRKIDIWCDKSSFVTFWNCFFIFQLTTGATISASLILPLVLSLVYWFASLFVTKDDSILIRKES